MPSSCWPNIRSMNEKRNEKLQVWSLDTDIWDEEKHKFLTREAGAAAVIGPELRNEITGILNRWNFYDELKHELYWFTGASTLSWPDTNIQSIEEGCLWPSHGKTSPRSTTALIWIRLMWAPTDIIGGAGTTGTGLEIWWFNSGVLKPKWFWYF